MKNYTITKNEEFIHRHVLGTCSRCGEKFYGGDAYAARLLSYDGKGKMRCSCGNVDDWMNFRDYGVSQTRRY